MSTSTEWQYDFLHDTVSLDQYFNYFLVMPNVVERKKAAPSIFQPFLGGLVSADLKVPRNFGHVSEPLTGIDMDFPLHIGGKSNFAVTSSKERNGSVTDGGIFHQVELMQLRTPLSSSDKRVPIGRVRDAREVDLQKLSEGRSVVGSM